MKKNPKKKSIKHDSGKPRLSLVSSVALFKMSQVMTDGESIYGTHNWRSTGFKWSRLVDSALRHITMWKDGMDNDPDGDRSNLANAMCNLQMLLEFEETHKHLDDRFKLPKDVLLKLYPPKKKRKKK